MLLPSKPFTKKWSLRIILSNNVKFVIPIDSSKDIRHLKNFIYGYIKQIFGYEYKILTVLDSEGFFLSQNFKIKDILKNRDTIHCFDTELSFGKYKLKEELNTEKIQIVCNDKSNVFDLSNKSLENIESHNKDICRRISKDKNRNEDIVKTPSKCIEDINSSILEKNNIKKEKNENLLQNKETEMNTDIEKKIKSAVDLSQIGIKKKRKSKDLNKTDKNKEIKNYKSFDKNEETNVEIMFDQRKDIEVVSNKSFDKNEETNVEIMCDQRKDIEVVSNKSLKENKINIDLGNEKILVEQEVSKEMEEETDNGSNTNQKTRVVRKTALKKEISKNSLPKNSLPKISKSKSVNSTPKKNITTEVKMVSARKSKKTCDFSLDEI
ncbi:hypothetical protein CWI36_2091p0010 [Hamiltosporidium magnivora]|uniref:Uncharacterized protein n=1 Tax=Hamiltosporidium magnivora TaxID=148818 RepID=A0A4Q9KWV6_9MICR|nr:hypothetical protein CWI36_2091p0010 [Hamiltosporidium magnivora]